MDKLLAAQPPGRAYILTSKSPTRSKASLPKGSLTSPPSQGRSKEGAFSYSMCLSSRLDPPGRETDGLSEWTP